MKTRLLLVFPFFLLIFFSLILAEMWKVQSSQFMMNIMVIAAFIPVISGLTLYLALIYKRRILCEISIFFHAFFCVLIVFFCTQIFDSLPPLSSLQSPTVWKYLYPLFLVPAISLLVFFIQKNVIRKVPKC